MSKPVKITVGDVKILPGNLCRMKLSCCWASLKISEINMLYFIQLSSFLFLLCECYKMWVKAKGFSFFHSPEIPEMQRKQNFSPIL